VSEVTFDEADVAVPPTSSIDRAVDLLLCVVQAGGPISLAEASARTGLAKPTAHRILRILAARGLLRQDEGRTYRLGATAFALAGQILSGVEFVKEARPALEWLTHVTPETIQFAMLNGDKVVYVEKIEGRQPYRMASSVGVGLDVHSTAIGKATLAFMAPAQQAQYLVPARLVAHTSKTITSVAVLREQLTVIRERGFAIDDGENQEDIRCVAAAVFDARGDVIGGISVSAPAFSFSTEVAYSLAPAVMTAARTISVALGAPASVLTSLPGLAVPGR
jgi:IclR family transcriptional regulator, acetate operon repressor